MNKQITIKLLVVLTAFFMYMTALSAYTFSSIHSACYATGVLVGFVLCARHCMLFPEYDETDMTFKEAFRYMTVERN